MTAASPWRTSSVPTKIKHCVDGLRTAALESSFMYCAGIDVGLLACAQFDSDNRQIKSFCAVVPLAFELINSAVERVVDRGGLAYCELARDAKDMSAAASMLVHSAAIAFFLLC